MPKFRYRNSCETGVLGLTDYTFMCTIEADTQEQALAWGHRVAEEYNNRFGLLPEGRRLPPERIERNGSIWTKPTPEAIERLRAIAPAWADDLEASLAKPDNDDDEVTGLFCRYGEMPDFPPRPKRSGKRKRG